VVAKATAQGPHGKHPVVMRDMRANHSARRDLDTLLAGTDVIYPEATGIGQGEVMASESCTRLSTEGASP
jgi:hypothetical protein